MEAADVVRAVASGDPWSIERPERELCSRGRRDVLGAALLLDDPAAVRRLLALGIVTARDADPDDAFRGSVACAAELVKAGLDPTRASDAKAALAATHAAVRDLRSCFAAMAIMRSMPDDGRSFRVADLFDMNLSGTELLEQATMMAMQEPPLT
jgi:hypothetical protein